MPDDLVVYAALKVILKPALDDVLGYPYQLGGFVDVDPLQAWTLFTRQKHRQSPARSASLLFVCPPSMSGFLQTLHVRPGP